MGNGITPLSQILYDLFFDMSLVVLACHTCNKRRGIENGNRLWEGYSCNTDCVSIIKLLKGEKYAGVK
jgi:hypothetical protein